MNYDLINSFFSGHCIDAYQLFGAHLEETGVRFTVYAPNAKNVQVAGDFNGWNGNCGWMEKVDYRGVWSTLIPEAKEFQVYKYRIETGNGWVEKADPYATYSELRPKWGSIIVNTANYQWTDKEWTEQRTKNYDRPVSIYEVHAGGWKRDVLGNWYTYQKLEEELIPYVKEHGFTHIEMMPLSAHPFDGSWGYQIFGFYSLTSRYGTVYDFQHFVDACHNAGIGVIMDFVPVHFASDAYGLVNFDGSHVYEYPNDADAHSEWGSYNFDLWKETTRSFLMSCASFWVDRYHVDGLRMDAISNIIYWQGNKNRGENQGALDFVRRMNYNLSKKYPFVMLIAEDSSDYPKVTHSTLDMGLGFDYKWDLGWMNDTLKYYKRDPIYRKYHHNDLTFSMAYFYSERFLLPLSHDEVVHGKLSIINKMWGSYEQKFAQCKNLFTYMMTHPGKKLNFMGNEFGHFREFDEQKELDWFLLKYPAHGAFERSVVDLMKIYQYNSAFYKYDYDYRGFQWIDADNGNQSVYSYYREDENGCFVVVLNMTPASYETFTIGVPYAGEYVEMYNTEKDIYNGCNMCNFKPIKSVKQQFKQFENSLVLRLAPFAGIIFECKKKKTRKTTKKKVDSEKVEKKVVKKTTKSTKKEAKANK
ncbi:MAG: 1,4-alpha-glucan branching protein GlgB [Erysipelotrichaceae bacterium]|nr:1,4-alpha-glucan branching protein GlgB [Erysipelotrichaceae bacterium]